MTLPKEWAETVGIKKNASVRLQPQSDGSLVLYPETSNAIQTHSTKVIDSTEMEDMTLFYRQLIGAYIAGHDTIEIRSDSELRTDVTSVASDFVQIAIGLEILEEDETHILIKDLINQNELRPIKSVERMKILVRNMLNDVLNALDRSKFFRFLLQLLIGKFQTGGFVLQCIDLVQNPAVNPAQGDQGYNGKQDQQDQNDLKDIGCGTNFHFHIFGRGVHFCHGIPFSAFFVI